MDVKPYGPAAEEPEEDKRVTIDDIPDQDVLEWGYCDDTEIFELYAKHRIGVDKTEDDETLGDAFCAWLYADKFGYRVKDFAEWAREHYAEQILTWYNELEVYD